MTERKKARRLWRAEARALEDWIEAKSESGALGRYPSFAAAVNAASAGIAPNCGVFTDQQFRDAAKIVGVTLPWSGRRASSANVNGLAERLSKLEARVAAIERPQKQLNFES